MSDSSSTFDMDWSAVDIQGASSSDAAAIDASSTQQQQPEVVPGTPAGPNPNTSLFQPILPSSPIVIDDDDMSEPCLFYTSTPNSPTTGMLARTLTPPNVGGYGSAPLGLTLLPKSQVQLQVVSKPTSPPHSAGGSALAGLTLPAKQPQLLPHLESEPTLPPHSAGGSALADLTLLAEPEPQLLPHVESEPTLPQPNADAAAVGLILPAEPEPQFPPQVESQPTLPPPIAGDSAAAGFAEPEPQLLPQVESQPTLPPPSAGGSVCVTLPAEPQPQLNIVSQPTLPPPSAGVSVAVTSSRGPQLEANSNVSRPKRGRPRKYFRNGPGQSSTSPPPPPPMGLSSPSIPEGGPPSNTRNMKPNGRRKREPSPQPGSNRPTMMPYTLKVEPGKDVAAALASFALDGPQTISILSAVGEVSSVTLELMEGYRIHEGPFQICSLCGAFSLPEDRDGGQAGRAGSMSISLSRGDRGVIGGRVAGRVVARSNVEVVLLGIPAGFGQPEVAPPH
ncbi:AT-hook motif nuclear-localized protein [Quillaja saponaria]|uniref:AT-hook motif nuclear-localized protein n=1 Tax=Quillaja saponaria TaxID=32244 RepID=A0AAD7PFR6_QUISA|nr:AT-hook motif nuclear-localized protein [Quillaja saponaria]